MRPSRTNPLHFKYHKCSTLGQIHHISKTNPPGQTHGNSMYRVFLSQSKSLAIHPNNTPYPDSFFSQPQQKFQNHAVSHFFFRVCTFIWRSIIKMYIPFVGDFLATISRPTQTWTNFTYGFSRTNIRRSQPHDNASRPKLCRMRAHSN
jgi:hypothetical protein